MYLAYVIFSKVRKKSGWTHTRCVPSKSRVLISIFLSVSEGYFGDTSKNLAMQLDGQNLENVTTLRTSVL